MKPLRNARHERFAQALVKGNSRAAAYALAGYRKDKTNAWRLLKRPEVQDRLWALQAQAAASACVTLAGITERLMDIVAKAEKSEQPAMLSVARMSLIAVAKLNGVTADTKARFGPTTDDLLDLLQAEEEAAADEAARARQVGSKGACAKAH